MDPFVSPWVPDAVLGVVGLVLLWFRSSNRDFPTFADAKSRGGLALFVGLVLAGCGGSAAAPLAGVRADSQLQLEAGLEGRVEILAL